MVDLYHLNSNQYLSHYFDSKIEKLKSKYNYYPKEAKILKLDNSEENSKSIINVQYLKKNKFFGKKLIKFIKSNKGQNEDLILKNLFEAQYVLEVNKVKKKF